MSNNIITRYCAISRNRVLLDGNIIFQAPQDQDFPEFAKAAYHHFGMEYPKFSKMDNLCKLAFLAAEICLEHGKAISRYKGERTGVVISNKSSSLDTDIKFQETVSSFPSPSLFVYTLPNIMIGEICIRHKIKGENACFISEKHDVDLMMSHVDDLLDSGKADACIAGWVDFMAGGYDAILYLVEKKQTGGNRTSSIEYLPERVKDLYNKTEEILWKT